MVLDIYNELESRNLIAQSTNYDKVKDILNNEKIVFYLGCDPTADSLHVGSYVQLMLVSRLQKAGHSPICLFGGATGLVGDPSGKNSMRRLIPKEEVEHNIECFKNQISKFLDISNVKFVNNADWLCDLNYIDFLREVGTCFNVNKMIAAECYKQRLADGLTFLELNYMIMQGYDFFHLHNEFGCSLQIGGSDQWSNIIAGIELIRKKTQNEVYGLTSNLLTNSDGKKMGKTEKGALWLDPNKTSPYEFYQYWININDSDVVKCLKMLTDVDLKTISEIENLKGKEIIKAKEMLAFEITKSIHGESEANKARSVSSKIFSSNTMPKEAPTIIVDISDFQENVPVLDLLLISKIIPSKSEGKRLITQRGISINEKLVSLDQKISKESLEKGILVKKGKKTYNRVICKN